MIDSVFYRAMADGILLLHACLVVFVVVGLILVVAGGGRGWSWVRNPWFRLTHLLVVGVIVAQSWLGVLCPLTILEMALRSRAGGAAYTGSFVAHWLGTLLYFDAPPWVFNLVYTFFGLLVIGSWILVRPRPFARRG